MTFLISNFKSQISNSKRPPHLWISALALGLALGGGVSPLYAASKMLAKTAERPGQEFSQKTNGVNAEAQEPSFENETAEPASSAGQSGEKLLFTLNETLVENRKIRESMRDLQAAFEKMAIEKSNLLDQVKTVERLAIQRNKETGQQVSELTAQLERSKKELEKLQADNTVSVTQKMKLEKKLEALNSENTRSQENLKGAILPEERDLIVARMDQNDEAVNGAVAQIAALDRENAALKEQVIQSYFDLGNMDYDLGRYEDAVQQYLHVLEWNPNHAWAHHNLAVIYDYHFHKVQNALVQYRKYMNVKPASEEAREVRMRLWDLEQLTKLEPPEPLKEDFKKLRKV